MKIVPAAMTLTLLILVSLIATAQTLPSGLSATAQPSQEAGQDMTELNSLLADLQQWTLLASHDLAGLRIEKWKTDNPQKMQMEEAVTSLQRNLATIVPGPANDLRNAPGSASKSFKLYHNMNLVYEFLSSVTGAAGSFGRQEEYGPLAGDVASLSKLRHRLSQYSDQAAAMLETDLQEAKAQEAKLEDLMEAAAQASAQRKAAIEDPAPAKKPKKTANKKISAVGIPAPAQ
ncbi:MAG TPA: hypothetical protein VNW97_14950 [Candidatus Saccharimonadales bacterium]|jgi:hypothetical protein|nr:hypothetical protein [Candidatus Saccharimonadales bacterium]